MRPGGLIIRQNSVIIRLTSVIRRVSGDDHQRVGEGASPAATSKEKHICENLSGNIVWKDVSRVKGKSGRQVVLSSTSVVPRFNVVSGNRRRHFCLREERRTVHFYNGIKVAIV